MNAEVRLRACGRCEYCRFPESHAVIPFEVEHIIPLKHGGITELKNLALACFYCNRYKGPNVAGLVDPGMMVVRLFHPRVDSWDAHFVWAGPELRALTDTARATISVLRINQPNAVAVRRTLMNDGLWI